MIDLSVHPKVEWRKARIPKKSGGFRELIIPGDELKAVQKSILEELYVTEGLGVTSFASGFVPYRNTIYGAMKHAKDADYIIEMDVHNFFPSFNVDKVRPYLINSGLGMAKVEYIMKYCVYEEKGHKQFPQGAPTSPYLTNIGMKETDLKLDALAANTGLTYSRYADDLTFATTDHIISRTADSFYPFIKKVECLLDREQELQLSRKKTRVIFKNSPRVPRRITGVVVRKDGLGYNAPKKIRHKARCLCHILWKKLQDKEDIKDLWPMYREMKGLICYCDYLRSYSDGDAATADPVINPLKFNFIEEHFNMQFDPTEIRGNIVCAEAGDQTKPGGTFISKHNEKTAYSFLFDQAWVISKEQLIKELKETETNKDAQGPLSYYVLRDLSNKRYFTVCPDGIYKYNVQEFKEAPISDVREALLSAGSAGDMKKTVLNTITPVLAYWDGGVRQAIALKMPPVRFRYQNSVLGINQMITLPPVLYKVEANGGVIVDTWVCVIAQDSTDINNLRLAHLPFPNVYSNSRICVGSTRSMTNTIKKDIISVAYAAWDLFVNSTWNVDLLDDTWSPSNLDEVFAELKDVPDELTRPAWEKHRKLIAVLRDKDGWTKLQWVQDTNALREFFRV